MSAYEVPRPARWWTPPQRVDVRGADLAHRRDGSGEPVLFVHGHWLTRRWTPFHARLAERVDLVAPELPGFGDSPADRAHTTRDDMVLLLRDLLGALELPSAHVVGYGLGGWVAADLAVWAPAHVRSLTLVAPFGLRVPGEPLTDVFLVNPTTYLDVYFNGDAAGVEGGVDDLVPGMGTPAQGGPEEFAQRYGELGAAAAMIWSRRYDLKLEDRLPLLHVPALVVGSTSDRVVPAAHLDGWAKLLGARRVDVPGAGHGMLVQQPDAVAAAVADFVEGQVAR